MPVTGRFLLVASLAVMVGCDREAPRQGFRYDVSLSVTSPETLAVPAKVSGRIDMVAMSPGIVVARFVEPPSPGPGQLAVARTKELERPVVIEYDRGRLRGIRFSADSSPGTRRLWGQIAGMAQLPVEPTAQWTAEEIDDTGPYQAEYRVGTDRSVTKRKLAYEQRGTGVSVVRSEWKLRAVAGSPWANTQGSEEIEVASPAGKPIHATVEGSVVGSTSDAALELAEAAPLSQPLVAPGAFVTGEEVAHQHDRNLTEGKTVQSIVAEWRKTDDDARRVLLGDRLASLLRVNPKAVPTAKQLIGPDAALSGLVFRALAEASTPESLRTLIDVLVSEHYEKDRRLSAGQALATSFKVDARVTDELARSLGSLSGEVKGAGLLAYGAWIRRLREASSPEAEQHLRSLVTATRAAAGDASEYRRYLDALGNTGAAEAEDTIVAALSHEAEEVRDAAVGALRAVPTSTAEKTISQTMLRDRSPRVRAGAILAATFRPMEGFLPALGELLRAEARPFVRKRAIAWLASKEKEVPAARELLERQARVDPDQGVREQAQRLLHGGPAAPTQKGVGKP